MNKKAARKNPARLFSVTVKNETMKNEHIDFSDPKIKKKLRIRFFIIGLIIAAFFGAGYVTKRAGISDSERTRIHNEALSKTRKKQKAAACDDFRKQDAYIAAMKATKEKLSFPLSAKFPGIMVRPDHCFCINDSTVRINSFVDSKNAFGVLSRSRFNTFVVFGKDKTVSVEGFQFLE